jgi:murein DD-endopeptidase MepM/ murein hydrolase activator NlpD
MIMSWRISGSVGRWERGARNHRRDVETVQTLLTSAAARLGNPDIDPQGIDGVIGRPPARSSTVDAIEAFQSRFFRTPDGLIGVNGRTWNELVREGGGLDDAANPNPPDTLYFPFPVLPSTNWTHGARAFASNRSRGKRAHAGCDLYFPQGTWIYAIADGKVTRGPEWFYAQTYALEVDHGDFIARYGEVQPHTMVRGGDTVRAGQKIARVGRLVGISVPSDMLHLELFDKSASGPLTVSGAGSARRTDGVPFLRRRDLMDPTTHLGQWSASLPQAY